MEEDFDLFIKKELISEVAEKIEEIEKIFLEFDRNSTNISVIDEIFRLAHNVKGSAMSVGFNQLGEFAHIFETLLSKIKEKTVVINSDIVDVLLRSNDKLREFINELGKNFEASIDTKDLVQEINVYLGGAHGEAPKASEPELQIIKCFPELERISTATFQAYATLAAVSLDHLHDPLYTGALKNIQNALEKIIEIRNR